MLVHASISSWLDYCKVLFSCMSKASLHHLQAVQNAVNSLVSPCTGYWLVTDISIKSSVLRLCLYEVRHPLISLSFYSLTLQSGLFVLTLVFWLFHGPFENKGRLHVPNPSDNTVEQFTSPSTHHRLCGIFWEKKNPIWKHNYLDRQFGNVPLYYVVLFDMFLLCL